MTLDVFAPELRQSLSRGTSSRPSSRKKHRSLKIVRNARLLRKKCIYGGSNSRPSPSGSGWTANCSDINSPDTLFNKDIQRKLTHN
jgi:hypothetical protein